MLCVPRRPQFVAGGVGANGATSLSAGPFCDPERCRGHGRWRRIFAAEARRDPCSTRQGRKQVACHEKAQSSCGPQARWGVSGCFDPLNEPGKRILTLREDDVVLEDVVEVDVQAAIVIENGDRPAAVDVRPEVGFVAMRLAGSAGPCDHCRAPR